MRAGFDGYKGEDKALIVFARRPDGTIYNVSASQLAESCSLLELRITN
jgi:hypothetical protein